MFRDVLSLCSFRPDSSRNKKKSSRGKLESHVAAMDHRHAQFPVMDEHEKSTPHRRYEYDYSAFSREDHHEANTGRKKSVSSNFSDLIQKFAASCLLRPVTSSWQDADELSEGFDSEFDDYYKGEILMDEDEEEAEDGGGGYHHQEKPTEVQVLMSQMFDAVSSVKMAYMALQEAHCTWDPDRMREADVAVVEELTRLGALGEMWRRRSVSSMCKKGGGGDWKIKKTGGGCGGRRSGPEEVVWPYELSVEELKREVKAREVDVEKLKEKLDVVGCWSYAGGGGKKSKSQSKRKVSCYQGLVAASPAPELFEATMRQVREATKSFTSLLLSLMRAAHWDIPAAVRSIEPAAAFSVSGPAHRAKYALESYVTRKIFNGFDHESFFMDRSLSSLLNSDQYRRDCFTQFRDMKSIDPMDMLEALPACNFSKFCSVKYLSIIHPKMEESFFGNLDQQRLLMAGRHPRTQFYADFLGLAKAVWLLHLLAFSLEPPPSLFEADRGAEFHPQYMDSAIKFGLVRVPSGLTVGFPVCPGFKLGNGTVIKARVYLVNAS
ncbi:hypothetical protein SAY87_015897 [Trapa incisa]|uniref:DUF641 domain-containing protein n=1 Tax=Trapa incisa TaxID=236973 RepID=A0AAN7QX05_9MYRT|nr:hypothetical protein SAY87_015897 [Trapa incisa]